MKVDRSRALYERACKTCPGGIHSNVRKNWQPLPLFYERGQGSHVWDVDGNEHIDYVLARGPLLLGHSPKPVLDAVRKQLDVGLMYAGQSPIEVDAAEKVVELVPCAEMVRFSNSGSEAVHGALRLARGVTGRMKVVRFEGQYHGWFDSAFWNYAPPLDKAGPRDDPTPIPVSRGQVATDSENLVIRPWNDLSLVEQAFQRYPGQIAAVKTEPIMCNMGGILPKPGFLEGLRELCTKHGALLIFDEVITGFRVSIGGAQQHFGVTPDLATFAKAMAGGFPVSAIAGKAEYMNAFGELTITHAGTYNSNAPCMAATVAALTALSENDAALLRHAHAMGKQLMDGIAKLAKDAGKQAHVRGVPPAFHVSFNETEEVVDYRTFQSRDKDAYARFWAALQENGVRTIPDGLWFVSTAHTQQDVDKTLEAVAKALKEV
ncbi:MAG: aspartate aminotransferase family protein [Phycisphaerae bacterium]|nr:aspartate aminotransferase family protein [Phycisphaerae bacterium]